MSNRAVGGAENPQNLARPVARAAGAVAYVADIVILLTLIVQLLLGTVSGGRALLVGALSIAVFLLAAGLAFYGGGNRSRLLVGFAAAYSMISSVVLFLAVVEPKAGNGGGGQLLVVLIVAASVAAMAVGTARIAGLPLRRLAIPFILVALSLTIVATVLVVFDSSMTMGDGRELTLGRLLVTLIITGALIAVFLSLGRATGSPGLGRSRQS